MPGNSPLTFQSTKTYTHAQGLSCAFRQWRANSHCRFLHGYALEVKLTFETNSLDINNWVVDFGGLKFVKGWLEGMFDHKTLVALDDPARELFRELHERRIIDMQVVRGTGCEMFAAMIFEYVDEFTHGYNSEHQTSARLIQVEVREHAGNSAIAKRT